MDFWSLLQWSLVSDGGYIGSHGISIMEVMREHTSEAQSNKPNHSFKILEKHGLTIEFLFHVKYTETRTCGHRSLHLAGGNMVAA